MKKKLFAVKLHGGRMGIRCGTKKEILMEEGRANVVSIKPATNKEIDWVRVMGGYIPEGESHE